MKLIVFEKGLPIKVLYDKKDHQTIIKHRWTIRKGYAVTKLKRDDGSYMQVSLHRAILGITDRSIQVDHKNRNRLDNRRRNIRQCTHSENQKNRRASGRSKYLGVSFDKKYIVSGIRILGKRVGLGLFETEEDAARAYDAAAKIHHGEFANLNFPNQ